MKIGELQHQEAGSFSGFINTLELQVNFNMKKIPEGERTSQKSPHYTIMAGKVELGKAWIETVNGGPNNGLEYLSLSIDDMSFPDEIRAAAFVSKTDNRLWNIEWSRPKKKAAPVQEQAAA